MNSNSSWFVGEEAVEQELVETQCFGCLSSHRKLSKLGDNLLVFSQLLNNQYSTLDHSVLLCWECGAQLKKARLFKEKVEKAQQQLRFWSKLPKSDGIKSLSSLSFSPTNTADIEPDSTENNDSNVYLVEEQSSNEDLICYENYEDLDYYNQNEIVDLAECYTNEETTQDGDFSLVQEVEDFCVREVTVPTSNSKELENVRIIAGDISKTTGTVQSEASTLVEQQINKLKYNKSINEMEDGHSKNEKRGLLWTFLNEEQCILLGEHSYSGLVCCRTESQFKFNHSTQRVPFKRQIPRKSEKNNEKLKLRKRKSSKKKKSQELANQGNSSIVPLEEMLVQSAAVSEEIIECSTVVEFRESSMCESFDITNVNTSTYDNTLASILTEASVPDVSVISNENSPVTNETRDFLPRITNVESIKDTTNETWHEEQNIDTFIDQNAVITEEDYRWPRPRTTINPPEDTWPKITRVHSIDDSDVDSNIDGQDIIEVNIPIPHVLIDDDEELLLVTQPEISRDEDLSRPFNVQTQIRKDLDKRDGNTKYSLDNNSAILAKSSNPRDKQSQNVSKSKEVGPKNCMSSLENAMCLDVDEIQSNADVIERFVCDREIKQERIDEYTDSQVYQPTIAVKEEPVSDLLENSQMGQDSSHEFVYEVKAEPMSPDTSAVREHQHWKRSVLLVYNRLRCHRYASKFLHPITDDKAPEYSEVVKRPMDLGTIRRNVRNGTIRTTAEFQRDILLMATNALMYNSSEHIMYEMAKDFFEEAKYQLDLLLRVYENDENETPKPRAKRHLPDASEIAAKRLRMSSIYNDSDATRSRKRHGDASKDKYVVTKIEKLKGVKSAKIGSRRQSTSAAKADGRKSGAGKIKDRRQTIAVDNSKTAVDVVSKSTRVIPRRKSTIADLLEFEDDEPSMPKRSRKSTVPSIDSTTKKSAKIQTRRVTVATEMSEKSSAKVTSRRKSTAGKESPRVETRTKPVTVIAAKIKRPHSTNTNKLESPRQCKVFESDAINTPKKPKVAARIARRQSMFVVTTRPLKSDDSTSDTDTGKKSPKGRRNSPCNKEFKQGKVENAQKIDAKALIISKIWGNLNIENDINKPISARIVKRRSTVGSVDNNSASLSRDKDIKNQNDKTTAEKTDSTYLSKSNQNQIEAKNKSADDVFVRPAIPPMKRAYKSPKDKPKPTKLEEILKNVSTCFENMTSEDQDTPENGNSSQETAYEIQTKKGVTKSTNDTVITSANAENTSQVSKTDLNSSSDELLQPKTKRGRPLKLKRDPPKQNAETKKRRGRPFKLKRGPPKQNAETKTRRGLPFKLKRGPPKQNAETKTRNKNDKVVSVNHNENVKKSTGSKKILENMFITNVAAGNLSSQSKDTSNKAPPSRSSHSTIKTRSLHKSLKAQTKTVTPKTSPKKIVSPKTSPRDASSKTKSKPGPKCSKVGLNRTSSPKPNSKVEVNKTVSSALGPKSEGRDSPQVEVKHEKVTPKSRRKSMFVPEEDINLSIAITTDPIRDLTPFEASLIKKTLEDTILEIALNPKKFAPKFRENPIIADGVVKLWCEDERTLKWLEKIVSYIEAIPDLVIRKQTELPKKMECTILIPGNDDLEVVKRLLHAQNPWALVGSWVFHRTEQRGASTLLEIGVPSTIIPTLIAREQRLAYSLGSVDVEFLEGNWN